MLLLAGEEYVLDLNMDGLLQKKKIWTWLGIRYSKAVFRRYNILAKRVMTGFQLSNILPRIYQYLSNR